MFYLIRHGSADYAEKDTKIYQGFGVNLAPLSERGIREIQEASRDARLAGTDLILSSPYTRALQTAAILSKELQADIVVETDLHEWLANKNYIYETDEKAEKSYREFCGNRGIYTNGKEEWEDYETMKKRLLTVLKKYTHYRKVLVVCHGMRIQSVCPDHHPQNGEIQEFSDVF